jgi:hypothetical protein
MTAYYFRNFPYSARWVAAADEKVGECFAPFLGDGYWWECSPTHSVYMLRGLCAYATGKQLLGQPVWNTQYHGKSLALALEALAKTADPYGEYPALNDSYRYECSTLETYPELRVPLYLIGRGDLVKMLKDAGDPPVLPATKLQPLKQEPPPYGSVLLPEAGLAIMRDGWEREDSYLLLDFGPHGGYHGHRDKLSFTLFAQGHCWIPDASVAPHYVVFPEQQSWHVQTIAHNTVMVNGESQRECTGKLLLWKTDEEMDVCSAQHTEGYPGILHRRTIVHPRNGYFVIHDTLCTDRETPSNLDWLLHVYGETGSQGKGRLLFAKGDRRLLVLSEEIRENGVKIEQGLCGGLERSKWRGSGYPPKGAGGWIYIPYLRLPKSLGLADRTAEYFVVLYPFAGEEPNAVTQGFRDARGRASGLRIAVGATEDWYIEAAHDYDAGRQGPYQCGEIQGDSRALFVRMRDGKTVFRKSFP